MDIPWQPTWEGNDWIDYPANKQGKKEIKGVKVTQENKQRYEWWWVFFPLAILLGTVAGFLCGNVGLGMILGAAVGTPLNLVFYYRYRTSQLDPDAS